jgi:hypothetical protein
MQTLNKKIGDLPENYFLDEVVQFAVWVCAPDDGRQKAAFFTPSFAVHHGTGP